MNFWLFSSKSLDSIEVAKERLLWGFWDRDAGEKRNWRAFIRLYNKIKPFNIVVFQMAKSGDIHAIGIVKEKYFDDQTSIWSNEKEEEQALYPWRVSLTSVIFSKSPLTTHFIKIENYVDGYGIGELSEHEFRTILNEILKKTNIELLRMKMNGRGYGGANCLKDVWLRITLLIAWSASKVGDSLKLQAR